MQEPSSTDDPKWLWVEWRPARRNVGVSKIRIAKSIPVVAGESRREVPVPDEVRGSALRLAEASERWRVRASIELTPGERRALKVLRDTLLAEEHRARKKSPALTFPNGTPEWARPANLEEVLASVSGRPSATFAVCADSRRKPPHLRASRQEESE